jgi:hypothetical protein
LLTDIVSTSTLTWASASMLEVLLLLPLLLVGPLLPSVLGLAWPVGDMARALVRNTKVMKLVMPWRHGLAVNTENRFSRSCGTQHSCGTTHRQRISACSNNRHPRLLNPRAHRTWSTCAKRQKLDTWLANSLVPAPPMAAVMYSTGSCNSPQRFQAWLRPVSQAWS